jgi:hypothetical protein
MTRITIGGLPALTTDVDNESYLHTYQSGQDYKVTVSQLRNKINENYSTFINDFLTSTDSEEARNKLNLDRLRLIPDGTVTYNSQVSDQVIAISSDGQLQKIVLTGTTPALGTRITIIDIYGVVNYDNPIEIDIGEDGFWQGNPSINKRYSVIELIYVGGALQGAFTARNYQIVSPRRNYTVRSVLHLKPSADKIIPINEINPQSPDGTPATQVFDEVVDSYGNIDYDNSTGVFFGNTDGRIGIYRIDFYIEAAYSTSYGGSQALGARICQNVSDSGDLPPLIQSPNNYLGLFLGNPLYPYQRPIVYESYAPSVSGSFLLRRPLVGPNNRIAIAVTAYAGNVIIEPGGSSGVSIINAKNSYLLISEGEASSEDQNNVQ